MSWQNEDVCITGVGMATALAPTLRDSCAAFRAGITRISELDTVTPDYDESLGEEPVIACRARYLAEGYCSGAKVVLLGELALRDLLTQTSLLKNGPGRTGIVVCLADCSLLESLTESVDDDEEPKLSTSWKEEAAALVARMLAASGLVIAEKIQHVLFGGHTGFVDALQLASGFVRSGQLDRCIVGAVDSNLDPEFLVAAAVAGLLKTPLNPVGFVPGEAAAFALLERATDEHRARSPLASFACGPVIPGKFSRFSDKPPDGDVLAHAIRQLIENGGHNRDFALVIGDLNGDEYRARNWGNALIRLGNLREIGNLPMCIPALSFGELGAASGAVGLCLAVRAMELNQPGGSVLNWLSDETGAAAAMMFRPVTGG